MSSSRNDRYVRMYGPILAVLREAGGEAHAREVMRRVADEVLGGTPERERELASGGNAAENEVAWARNNLKEAGLIDASTRGVWRLTSRGWDTHLNLESARKLGRLARIRAASVASSTEAEQVKPDSMPLQEDSSNSLLDVMKSLPPSGFERLCQRILRQAGFEEVEVTGRSGDGGIDGHGVLQVNELVSFRVLFQCKRYQGSVGVEHVRNFRGAMSGRTDKGIILTTGSFTVEAQREAIRDGVPPIELVDGEKLVSLMERLQIGVKPRVVFDVDLQFFEKFQQSNEIS
jgi:restriction system protein